MAGLTIDKFDLNVYNLYAIRTKMIEQTMAQFQLDKAGVVPPQTLLVNVYPKMNELDILLGITSIFTPWAYFFPPSNYRTQRRSPFAFYRVAPTLGSFKEQQALEEKIASMTCQTPEEEAERQVMSQCLKTVDRLNGWVGYVVGKMGEFLQG